MHYNKDLPFFHMVKRLRRLKFKKIKKVLSPQRLVRCSSDVENKLLTRFTVFSHGIAVKTLEIKKIKRCLSPQRLFRCSLDVEKSVTNKIFHFFTWCGG